MAEEDKQNMTGEVHNSEDDDQTENLETVIRMTVSANPDQDASLSSEITDPSMLRYTTGGTEVQPSDVSVFMESNQISLGCQNSGKNQKCTVFQEFPTNNENANHASPISVESMNKFSFHKSTERSDNNKILSPLQKTEEKLTELLEKGNLSVTRVSENTWKMEERSETVPPSTNQNKRCREESNPCIPLIKRPLQNDDVIKCPDCPSDEFADIEDNVKDSSSNEEECNMEKSLTLEFQPEERDSRLRIGSTFRKRNPYFISSNSQSGTTSNSSSSDFETNSSSYLSSNNSKTNSSSYSSSNNSEHNDLRDKTIQELFPSTSKKHGELFNNNSAKKHCEPITTKLSNGTKKKFESSMETIPEAPELENDGETSYPSSPIPKLLSTNFREKVSKTTHATDKLKMRPKVVKRSDRCHVCNAKLGLCGIKCRCGGYYCAKHRYDREHDCTFDYKSLGRDEIRRNNPKITAEKVRKL